MSPSFTSLRRHWHCFSSTQLAEKHLQRAAQLISTGKRADVEAAIAPLDAALELYPNWEKALELKARGLLYLKRFKDVVEMLHEFLPTIGGSTPPDSPIPPPSAYTPQKTARKCLSLAKLRQKISSTVCKGSETRLGWQYLILGQACCHLGMMEDAMILLQSGKKTASAASRRHSNGMREGNFCSESSHVITSAAEVDLVNHMIANIKLLLRRRAAAIAALEAGLYSESVRHFSKIIEGQKGTPRGFIADCYLHRAIAYQATGRVVDAIADCNRHLALIPRCTKALSVRASLHEMVKSFSECLFDLQQLKLIYEASLRYQTMAPESAQWTIRQRNSSDMNISGGLDYINSKIAATRKRLCSRKCSLDARTVLDMPENCSMEDVEKAYLLLSLKHRPDKAALFVDNFLQQDGCRDMEMAKEEAKASALRLSQLIQKAYTKLLSAISEEESEKQNELYTGVEGAHYANRCWPSHNIADDEDRISCSSEGRIIDDLAKISSGNEGINAVDDNRTSNDEIEGVFTRISNDEIDDLARINSGNEGINVLDDHKISINDKIEGVFTRISNDEMHDLAGISSGNEGNNALNDHRISINDEIEGGFTPIWESQGDDEDERSLNSFSIKQEEPVEPCNGAGNKAITVVMEALIGSFEPCHGGDNKAITVLLEAFTGFKFFGNDMAKAEKLRRAFAKEKCVGEFCQLMSSHGGFSRTAMANVISRALSNGNPILAHHWLSTATDWSMPHSQPLPVT